jgi:predicted RNA-binding Zn-ribbon protein involved in translation (DUF1610 family)
MKTRHVYGKCFECDKNVWLFEIDGPLSTSWTCPDCGNVVMELKTKGENIDD